MYHSRRQSRGKRQELREWFCTCTRSCARADDARIVRSRDAQCNTKESTLRTFARNFSDIDFFPKILPLKDDELVMSEM